jgi:hypothetical protein
MFLRATEEGGCDIRVCGLGGRWLQSLEAEGRTERLE